MALVSGIEEAKILEIKQTEIHDKAGQSIRENGWLPNLFRSIVGKAKEFLQAIIREKDMPPKPVLDMDMDEFRTMQTLMLKVQKQAKAIKKIQEITLPNLRQQLAETTGIFKGKERKALEKQIQQTESELKEKLNKLPDILKDDGYPDVQAFMKTYRKAEAIITQYNQDLAEWEQTVKNGQKPAEKQHRPPERQSVRNRLRQLQEERVNRVLSRSRERNPKAEEALKSRIGQPQKRPRRRTAQLQKNGRINLLLDIQSRLQGRGPGYERWLKIHNLKEAARTLNYLTEHDITEYDVLAAQAASTASEFEKVSASIKQYEHRIEQVAALKTHIINYAKTHDTYVAYRKASPREKAAFRSAHEADLLLHEAAKRAFNDLGTKKLPTVKILQAEYADLLAKKKTAYEDFKRLRKESQELQTVKANVDALLRIEQVQDYEQEKEKNQEQGR